MAPQEPPPDRCGFGYDVSTLLDVGQCTCWRPTWDDEDRCVWHADRGDKPREELEALAPEPGERLDGAVVRKVSLDHVDWFEDCVLIGADLSSTDLRNASVAGADLREATLEHVDARHSDFSAVNLEDATLSICDFRHTSFVNARFEHAVFSNARISRETEFGRRTIYEKELDETDDPMAYESRAEAAVWAYREIHTLHEDNALPVEARHYYHREKNVRRKLAWKQGNRARALMSEAARWTTGYGMNPWRVVGTAILLVVVSAVLYPTTGGLTETVVPSEETTAVNGTTSTTEQTTITWEIDDPESASPYYLALVFYRSLYFSVVTFTTLGYGDISPVGDVARAIAGIEALLGQLFMALLVFVLTRRIS